MKTLLKQISSVVLVLLLALILVGCEKDDPDDDTKDTYDEKNYGLRYTYTYKEEMNYNDAKALLEGAMKTLKETKSYSYSQTINGAFDDEVEYTGVTKINITDKVEASVELVGNLELAMYVKDNKAYINNNEKKYFVEFESDGSNLDALTSSVIGNLPSLLTIDEERFVKAGTDQYDVQIIELVTNDGDFLENEGEGSVTLVFYKGQLKKVLYYNESEMTYIAQYSYEPVTITFPSDLDDYEQR